MPGTRIDKNCLIIEPYVSDIDSSLTAHFERSINFRKSYYPISIAMQTKMRVFCQQHQEKRTDVTSVKFRFWDENCLSVFIGEIAMKFSNITELDLSDTHIRDSDIPFIIAAMKSCPTLKKIRLNGNYISSQGAAKLLNTLLVMPELEEVDLSENDIGAQTCHFLKTMLETFTDCKASFTMNLGDDEIARLMSTADDEREQQREYLGELADEFSPGDLLYGLHAGMDADKGRNPVEAALKMVLKKQAKHQLLIINPFSDWVVNRNRYEMASKKDLVLFTELLDKTHKSLYPEESETPFIRGWSEHKVLCKLGLLWARDQGKTVHYVLDDLRMEKFSSGDRDHADTSVTESEIKFVARFYPHLKGNVQFWRTDEVTGNLVKASPPWLDSKTKHHWDGYMKAQKSKMRFFPKGPMTDKDLFEAMFNRKEYSLLAYKAALEKIVGDIISKVSNPAINSLMSKHLVLLMQAKNKHGLQKIIFALSEEYKTLGESTTDENVDAFLKNVIKPAKSYRTEEKSDAIFYRRSIASRLYGNQVFDMKALFGMADELETQQRLSDQTPSSNL